MERMKKPSKKSLKDLTAPAVLRAIADYDKRGGPAFLAHHEYRAAAKYVVVVNGRPYPPKAIVGVALGLACNEFSGGVATVGKALQRCGFAMEEQAS
jgi:5-methylcytosine-specific restriction protein A